MKRGFVSILTILILSIHGYAKAPVRNFPAVNVPEGMVLIPSGSFEMGISTRDLDDLVVMGKNVPHMSPGHAESWFGDERPRHTVSVAPFFMDRTEVTNRAFQTFVSETGYRALGKWEKYASPDRKDQPVVNVTWIDARAYAEWAGKRLPTEAEWEYAAGGGTGGRWFPWGNTPDESRANWRHQGETFWDGVKRLIAGRKIATQPVGSYPPNAFGLDDMCGNVREWCADDYGPYPGLQESDWQHTGYRPWPKPGEPPLKVVRGGSWDTPNPVFMRITHRSGMDPGTTSYEQGFRCAMDITSAGH